MQIRDRGIDAVALALALEHLVGPARKSSIRSFGMPSTSAITALGIRRESLHDLRLTVRSTVGEGVVQALCE